MRLCFGTFITILCSGKAYGIVDAKLVGTMTQTVDPSCSYINNKGAVSKLKSCKINLSDNRKRQTQGGTTPPISNVIQMAKDAKNEDVTKKFKDKVLPLIDNVKKRKILLALRDLIQDDEIINTVNKEKFKHHVGISINDFFGMCAYEEKIIN